MTARCAKGQWFRLDRYPSLPRHVRIQFDPVRQAFAVLSPERVFWPNEISLDILRRCDGRSIGRPDHRRPCRGIRR